MEGKDREGKRLDVKKLLAYKTELNPNNKQRTMFLQCAGTARFVYNWALAEWETQYSEGGYPSVYSLRRYLNHIKNEEFPWVRALPYAMIESAASNLGLAFKRYFREKKDGTVAKRIAKIKEKGKWETRQARMAKRGRFGYKADPGYPQFKQWGQHDSFQLRSTRIEHDRIRLTHIGWVRLKERGYIPTTGDYGIYATISRRADRWYISVLVKEDAPDLQAQGALTLGIDFGLKTLAVCSDGTVFENLHSLRQAERKLARLNRELSRRTKGGANWKKTQRKIQRCYAGIANIRNHTVHQISHHVTTKANVRIIILENLNVEGMLKNRRLSKAISDAAFSELRRQIEYKAGRCGIQVVIADRWFPSSKTCSECGAVRSVLKLSERTFVCSECGFILDRDLNAARNLAALSEGQSMAGLPVELGCSNALL